MHSCTSVTCFSMYTTVSIDWTGDPGWKDPHCSSEFYGPVAVKYNPITHDLSTIVRDWRARFCIPTSVEFKGYNIWKYPGAVLAVAEFVIESVQVVGHLVDKDSLFQEYGSAIFDKPRKLVPATGICALEAIWEAHTKMQVVFDKGDFEGRRQSDSFKTEIRQSAGRHKVIIRDVKGIPSDKSGGVQLADIVAHLLQRDANNRIENAELRRATTKMKRKSGNEIRVIGGNDLRPYL